MNVRLFFMAAMQLFLFSSCSSQINLQKTMDNAVKVITGSSSGKPTDTEVSGALKEALSLGAQNAATVASRIDGFYKNPAIFIPFPPEAKEVENTVRTMGMNKQVDDFIRTLNRAAEEAAKEAAPIFLDAVKQMTIQDAWSILRGDEYAATNYLKKHTSDALYVKFKPIVNKAIDKVQLTRAWEPIIKTYNKVPFVKKMNPDLKDYTTRKAIDGLFYLIGKEEEKIRKDPAARVSDLLRKVFGYEG